MDIRTFEPICIIYVYSYVAVYKVGLATVPFYFVCVWAEQKMERQ